MKQLHHLALAVGETALFLFLLYGLWRLAARWQDRLDTVRAPGEGDDAPLNWAHYARSLLSRLVQLVALFLSAGLAFGWLTAVLFAFDATRGLGEQLDGMFFSAAATVLNSVLEAIPGLVVVAVLLLLAQAAVEASNAVFRAISQRQLRVSMIHPETASATRRLVALGIWAVALVSIYPYLPGSNSDVFKGVSVLFGAMLTLGSSGVVNQLMSGLTLVYSRALRVGDYVVVGRDEGVVLEVGTLATKLLTMRNEEVTIPNAVLVSNPIRNYSKQSGSQGTRVSTTVTIGYDAPWRQIHALLLDAAQRTGGLRADPKPYVLQRALSDFYVEYELLFHIDRPVDRLPILSTLLGQIQDCFNEAGVQIMSPHFMTQPADPVLSPVPPPAR